MGQHLAPTTALTTISRQDLEAKIEALHGRLEAHPAHPTRFCVSQAMAPSTQERRQLSAARDRLEQRLARCDDDLAIEALISQFLIGFELGRGGGAVNTAGLNERYVRACRGLPLAAIQAAIDRFESVDGKTPLLPWNRTFRPNPAEFGAEVREGMVSLRTRLLHVRRVLEAEVYVPPTDEQRAKVAEAQKAFLEEHSLKAEARRVNTHPLPVDVRAKQEAQIQDGLARLREVGRDPSMGRLMARLEAKRAVPAVRSAEGVGR